MYSFFILGRNPELSLAEVQSYLTRHSISVQSYVQEGIGLLVEHEGNLPPRAVDELGGALAQGTILLETSPETMHKDMASISWYGGTEDKLTYVVWDFESGCEDAFVDMLKTLFRKEKLKATHKPLTGLMDMQSGRKHSIIGNKVDEQYVCFGVGEQIYLGRVEHEVDDEALESRDMGKPVRRSSLAMSPRMAKIMLNLSQVEPGQRLVDPFCGIGVILSEALLQNVDVIGIDKDAEAIAGAHKNLEWSGFDADRYQLHVGDSTRFGVEGVDVMVSEPDLGDILRKAVPEARAKNILGEFETLLRKVLMNILPQVGGRIVFSAPYILQANRKRRGCDIDQLLGNLPLVVVEGPYVDFRKGQVVGREIFVLDRK